MPDSHIRDTPEVSGSSEEGTMHSSALWNIFIRPFPSSAGDVAIFPNTKKQT